MSSPKRIFISYRRVDSQPSAGRISDDLKRAFGDDAVFRDINDIAPGKDFVNELDARLAGCGVLLAIIGPVWLDQLRLRSEPADGSIDYVRREIERACALSIDVIPVLVQGAVLPEAKDLPSSLQALARLQAHEQNDKSWRHDMQVLLKLLETRTGYVAADPFKRYWGMWQGLRQLGAALVSPHGLAVSAAVALAGAIGIGLYEWRQRADEANADVALLMRPYNINSDALDEIQVFKDLRGALKLALPDSHVELIPPGSMAAEELDRYRPEEMEELLKIKGERGYPRIFIQTHYSFDKPTGMRRVSVTPLLRPTDRSQETWKSVEGWPLRAYDGPVSRRVAVKVAFELIEFLAAKGVLRLQPEELRNARATLLHDYRGLLVTVEPPCEEERNLLAALADTAAAGANAESTRRLLNIKCTKDEVAPAPDRSARTAAAVYRGALGL